MLKTKKGFTMVELLVTIVIIGLLFTLGYFSISSILNRANNSYYVSQEDMVVLSGRDYFADYRSELPKEIGKTNSVTLKTLIDEGYIDPVKDRNDHDCDYEGSTVTAQKITNDEYQYYVTLICDNDNYETSKDEADPVIKFTPNKESSTEAITVKMEVTDNVGVASYRYVIIKEGETYYDSDYQVYNGEVTINLTEKGLYTIIGYAIDTSGNRGDRESGKYSIYQGIDCANVEFNNSVAGETWTNKNIDIDIKVPENTYRFEVSYRLNGGDYVSMEDYVGAVNPKFTISDEGKTQIKVVAYDSHGNSCTSVSKEYYIDKTKPECNISTSGTIGNNDWYRSNVALSLNRTDNLSGITQYGLTTSSSATYNSKASDSQVNTAGTTWYGYVKDAAGNTNSCSVSVKVDTTAPSCAVYLSGTKGDNDWYKQNNVSLSLSHLDILSGVASYGLTTSTSTTYNGTTTASQGDTGGVTWRGYVMDNAGNVSSCSSTFKVDTTAPTCSVSASGTSGNNGWYKERNVTLTLNRNDNLSGVNQYGLTTSGSATYNSTASASQGNTGGTTWRGYVKDAAGNTASCSASVKVDTTAPTCSVSFNGTSGNNGWYRSNASVSLGRNDNLSGVANYGLTTSTSTTYNGSTSNSQGNTTGTTWRGYIMDAAGNTNSCSNTVKVDTTAPTCSISVGGTGGSNGWYKSNVTLTLNRNDSYSGVANYGLTTSGSASYNGTVSVSQGNTSGATWRGYVIDAAGNTGSCSTTVKVDNQGPSINLVVGSTNGSYNTTNISYSISASDGRSGVDKYCFTTGGTSCTPNTYTTSQSNISGGFSSYNGTTRTMAACVSDKSGNVSCTTRNYTVYNQCSSTVNDGGLICGAYGACDCNAGAQYATSTQYKKDTFLGVSCPAVVTNNGCSQACSCCSEDNPTACPALYPCRTSTTAKLTTAVYDQPDGKGAYSSIYQGTKLYYLGDAGNYSYKVYVTEFKNHSPYHQGPYNIAYIYRNCITTDPSANCTNIQCPTPGH